MHVLKPVIVVTDRAPDLLDKHQKQITDLRDVNLILQWSIYVMLRAHTPYGKKTAKLA